MRKYAIDMTDIQTGVKVRTEWMYFLTNQEAEDWCEKHTLFYKAFYSYHVNWRKTNAINPIDMAD